jgi:HTH-type transcriptional regulator, transcriptional repressor of NAD biosynthesis genes
MPLHTGHLNLVSYGLKNCDSITLLLVASQGEPIEPELRYSWLVEHYRDNPEIKVDVTYRDSIIALPQEERTTAWCNFIKKEYPSIDCIISSEIYGDTLANYLGITHLKFDHKREITPISATEIRENYKKHIHFLPDHVKTFFNREKK